MSGDTQHKRDKVVAMLVSEWHYRHRAVSDIDRTVATSQRASPPAPQPRFVIIAHLPLLPPTRRHLYKEPFRYTTSPSPSPTPPSSLRPAHTPPTRSTWWYTCRPKNLKPPPACCEPRGGHAAGPTGLGLTKAAQGSPKDAAVSETKASTQVSQEHPTAK